jgi:hypothetical protein
VQDNRSICAAWAVGKKAVRVFAGVHFIATCFRLVEPRFERLFTDLVSV